MPLVASEDMPAFKLCVVGIPWLTDSPIPPPPWHTSPWSLQPGARQDVRFADGSAPHTSACHMDRAQ